MINPIDLSNYDSSKHSMTLDGSIELAKENILTISKLSEKINFDDQFITVDRNILEKYKNYLDEFCIWLALPEEYYYKPEYVAEKIYGTVDLWYLVLWMAQVPSAMEFNKEVIRVFDPSKIRVINYIINRDYDNVTYNNKNPKKVENLILQKVKIKDTRFI